MHSFACLLIYLRFKLMALTIYFFLLVASNCQGVNESSSTQMQLQNSTQSHHIQGLPYIQQRQSTQTNSTFQYMSNIEKIITDVTSWFYILHNSILIGSIQNYYFDNRICFTFAVIQIMGHFQVGLMHMLSSQTIMSSLFLKGLLLCIIVIVNAYAFYGILFSQKLKTKEYVIIAIYFTILLITGIWDIQSCERFQAYLFVFSPVIHIYYIVSKKKKMAFESITIVVLCSYFNNAIFLPMFMMSRPHLFYNIYTKEQIWFLQHFVLFIFLLSFGLIMLPIIEEGWILVSQKVINKLKLKLGMQLQEEVCIICLQKMDHFADLHRQILVLHSNDSDLYEASCRHIFHSKCILLWAVTKSECPIDNETLRI